MLKKLHFKSLLLIAVMLLGGASISWGQDYTYTLAEGDYSSSNHSTTVDEITWTHTHVAGSDSYGWDGTYGFKFGSGSSSYPTSFTLTSSSFSDKIKKIVVTANVNSKKSCKLDVKVGSTTYGSQSTISTKNNDTFEFSVDDALCVKGVVTLSFSSNKGPLYLKKIEVYYYSAPVSVTGVSLNKSEISIEAGNTEILTASVLPANASDKVVEWSTSNSSVATVDDGVVKGVAVGNATITVTTHEGRYTATCDVTVTKTEYLFYESFDECDNSGGNDDVWSGLSTTASITADNTGWTFSKGYPADQCARFGTGSANGYAQTPALGTAGNLIVSFKAGAWKDASTTLDLEISNGGTLSASSVTLADQAWSNYEIVIFNATASTKLTFSGNGRFFLDEVKVKEAVKEIKVYEAGFATYCSPFALDFSSATCTSGVADLTAYQAEMMADGKTVKFTPVDDVPAGTGVLVKGVKGATTTYNVPVVASSSTDVSGNKLVGVTEETEIGKSSAKGTHYVLKQNTEGVGFYKVNNDDYKVRANSAYLALTVGTGAKGFIPVDGTTAIELVDTASEVAAPAYNLQGQRVSNGYKGVVIVNGKKIMMK